MKAYIAPPKDINLGDYVDWFNDRNILFHILNKDESLSKNESAMLVLCGGSDVGKDIERDEREFRLIKEALDFKIPILGICRGLQIVNIALGGTLHQHIEEKIYHRKTFSHESLKTDNGRVSRYHLVLDLKNVSTERIIKEMVQLEPFLTRMVQGNGYQLTHYFVNSRHHQGIFKLGEGLIPMAFCTADNLIEKAICNERNILLVQWHPERKEMRDTYAETSVIEWVKSFFSVKN